MYTRYFFMYKVYLFSCTCTKQLLLLCGVTVSLYETTCVAFGTMGYVLLYGITSIAVRRTMRCQYSRTRQLCCPGKLFRWSGTIDLLGLGGHFCPKLSCCPWLSIMGSLQSTAAGTFSCMNIYEVLLYLLCCCCCPRWEEEGSDRRAPFIGILCVFFL